MCAVTFSPAFTSCVGIKFLIAGGLVGSTGTGLRLCLSGLRCINIEVVPIASRLFGIRARLALATRPVLVAEVPAALHDGT